MKLDSVTLEIMSNKVQSIADEMAFTLMRAGRTLYVKETADFSTALVDRAGKFFAYPEAIGVSGFVDLDCMPSIRAVGELEPGDIIITNHPYESEGLATHTPDLHIVAPYYHNSEIVCYGWSFLHSADVGGKVPCSISPSNHELYQEGLLIPPTKCRRGGKWDDGFLRMFRANCRTPEENVGDLQAMFAAQTVGQRRVGEIIEQHGLDTFLRTQEDLIEYTALKARAVLRQLPDGVYEFWDYLDDDLVTPVPLRIRLKMTVEDGAVHLDFTGTDPQVMSSFNIPTAGKRHAWLTLHLLKFIYTQDPTVPLNYGVFQSITATTPKGSIVNPEFPGAVGVRHATAIRLNDVVQGALARAVPRLIQASTGGIVIPVVLAERDGATGRQNVIVVEPMMGGMGGGRGHDGVDGRDSSISNLSNNPIETVEASAGAIIRHYGLRSDSAGPGEWRGGVGLELTFEILRDGVQVLGRGMERFRFRPWGLRGGHAGAPARTILNRGREGERDLGKIDVLDLQRGDRITILTPGGGGYGEPLRREPDAVRADVARGLVGVEAAERDYGVVVRDGRVDESATARIRGRNVRRENGRLFHFGPEREAWEAACDDETTTLLARTLYSVPLSVRSETRRRLFSEVLPKLVAADTSIVEAVGDAEASAVRFRAAVEALAKPDDARAGRKP